MEVIEVARALEKKREWEAMAQAYREVVVPYVDYQSMAQKVFAIVGDRAPVLDLGCGVGGMMEPFAKAGTEIVGVDSSAEMLRVARAHLKLGLKAKKCRLYQDDATKFDRESGFRAVVSSNVLHNLPRPQDMLYLDNAYKLLGAGGMLVITNPTGPPDIAAVEQQMRDWYKKQGATKAQESALDIIWKENKGLPVFNTFSSQDLVRILGEGIGFDQVFDVGTAYHNNAVIIARKDEERPYAIETSNDPERMVQGFRLRYHWLHDRHGFIPEREQRIHADPDDWLGRGCYALEDGTQKLLGFIHYVPPGTSNPPFEAKQLLKKVKEDHDKVGFLTAMYVLGGKKLAGIGSQLHAQAMLDAKQEGIDALVVEANPEVVGFSERFGAEVLGEVYQNSLGAPCTPMKFDLRKNQVLESIDKYLMP